MSLFLLFSKQLGNAIDRVIKLRIACQDGQTCELHGKRSKLSKKNNLIGFLLCFDRILELPAGDGHSIRGVKRFVEHFAELGRFVKTSLIARQVVSGQKTAEVADSGFKDVDRVDGRRSKVNVHGSR
jgi:hypothetical protein